MIETSNLKLKNRDSRVRLRRSRSLWRFYARNRDSLTLLQLHLTSILLKRELNTIVVIIMRN